MLAASGVAPRMTSLSLRYASHYRHYRQRCWAHAMAAGPPSLSEET